MTKYNPARIPYHIIVGLSAIYGWYLNIVKDSLAIWIVAVLSILYLAYILFEYVLPNGIQSFIRPIIKFISLVTAIVAGIIIAFTVLEELSPETVDNNQLLEKIFRPKNKKSQIRASNSMSWNDLIIGKDSCANSTFKIDTINGITELKAKQFLASLPILANAQRTTYGKKQDAPYRYDDKKITIETKNAKELELQEADGKEDWYITRLQRLELNKVRFQENGFDQYLHFHRTEAFKHQGMNMQSPFIVLYHEYNSPNTSNSFSNRFKTYRTFEYHMFIFRQNALDEFSKND